MSAATVLVGPVFLMLGAALGALHFRLLHLSVRRFAEAGAVRGVLALTLLRGAIAVASFWAIAQAGAVALIAALLGFLLARSRAQRRLGAA